MCDGEPVYGTQRLFEVYVHTRGRGVTLHDAFTLPMCDYLVGVRGQAGDTVVIGLGSVPDDGGRPTICTSAAESWPAPHTQL